MKELTRIVTAQITLIVRASDDDADRFIEKKDAFAEQTKELLKSTMYADDVNVTVQDFLMDVGSDD